MCGHGEPIDVELVIFRVNRSYTDTFISQFKPNCIRETRIKKAIKLHL